MNRLNYATKEALNKIEDLVQLSTVNQLINKKEENKTKDIVLWTLAIIGVVASVVAIAYAVCTYLMPDYLDDIEEYDDEDLEDDIEKDVDEKEVKEKYIPLED